MRQYSLHLYLYLTYRTEKFRVTFDFWISINYQQRVIYMNYSFTAYKLIKNHEQDN